MTAKRHGQDTDHQRQPRAIHHTAELVAQIAIHAHDVLVVRRFDDAAGLSPLTTRTPPPVFCQMVLVIGALRLSSITLSAGLGIPHDNRRGSLGEDAGCQRTARPYFQSVRRAATFRSNSPVFTSQIIAWLPSLAMTFSIPREMASSHAPCARFPSCSITNCSS